MQSPRFILIWFFKLLLLVFVTHYLDHAGFELAHSGKRGVKALEYKVGAAAEQYAADYREHIAYPASYKYAQHKPYERYAVSYGAGLEHAAAVQLYSHYIAYPGVAGVVYLYIRLI